MKRSYKKQTIIIIGSILIIMLTGIMLFIIAEKKEAYNNINLTFTNTKDSYEVGTELSGYEFIKSTNAKEVDVPKINTSKVGEISLIYVAYDSAGNHREFGLILNFVDSVLPILSLSQNEVTITEGDVIKLDDYVKEAYDPVDGKLKVNIEEPNDYKRVGIHKIIYRVKDENGNEVTAILKLIVKEKNKKELVGEGSNNNAQNGLNKATTDNNTDSFDHKTQTHKPNALVAKKFLFKDGYTMPNGSNSAFDACTIYKGNATGGCYPIIGSDGLYIGVEYIP